MTSMIEEIYHPWAPNIHCAKDPEITLSIIYNELCLCLNTITQGKVKCDPNPSYELVRYLVFIMIMLMFKYYNTGQGQM